MVDGCKVVGAGHTRGVRRLTCPPLIFAPKRSHSPRLRNHVLDSELNELGAAAKRVISGKEVTAIERALSAAFRHLSIDLRLARLPPRSVQLSERAQNGDVNRRT